MNRVSWKSRFGFIMASAGFAIGLGNIWRFPYIMGQNGGGAFLIIYILIAITIALPLFTMELSLGRKAQKTSIVGMQEIGPHPFWKSIGYIGIMATVLIMCYYVMVMAWVIIYAFQLVSGELLLRDSTAITEHFHKMTGNSGIVFSVTALIFLVIIFIISRGLQKGLEQVSKIFMPVLLFLFIAFAIWANTLEGSWKGLIWYLEPNFSELTPRSLLAAMGQSFYSVGVGMAIAFVFGSYLTPKTTNVPYNAALVVIFDTAIAIIAGLVIFPALFAFGFEPDFGIGLLFVTMTQMFSIVPGGQWIGAIFYLLIFIAGLTSILGAMEGLISTAAETFHKKRNPVLIWTSLTLLILSIPNILSFGVWNNYQILGISIFGWFDFLSGNVFLPVSALLLSIYVSFIWKFKNFQKDTNEGASKVYVFNSWSPFVRFVIPLAVGLILVYGLISSF